MSTTVLTILLLTVAASAMASVIPPSNHQQTGSIGTNSLISIGEGDIIDGKRYFANTTEMDWYEAREMCQQNDMQLATITNAGQFEFLMNSFTVSFSGSHWLQGRDAQTLRQFTWNSLGFEPSELVVDFGGVDIPYQLCLTFWSVAVVSRSQAEFCTDKYPVLCEQAV